MTTKYQSMTGKYREAAEQYVRLADAARSPPLAHRYRLDAVSALLDGSDVRGARSLLGETDPSRLSAPLRMRLNVQYARIALAERRPERALALLQPQATGGLPAEVVTETRLTRASCPVLWVAWGGKLLGPLG